MAPARPKRPRWPRAWAWNWRRNAALAAIGAKRRRHRSGNAPAATHKTLLLKDNTSTGWHWRNFKCNCAAAQRSRRARYNAAIESARLTSPPYGYGERVFRSA